MCNNNTIECIIVQLDNPHIATFISHSHHHAPYNTHIKMLTRIKITFYHKLWNIVVIDLCHLHIVLFSNHDRDVLKSHECFGRLAFQIPPQTQVQGIKARTCLDIYPGETPFVLALLHDAGGMSAYRLQTPVCEVRQ